MENLNAKEILKKAICSHNPAIWNDTKKLFNGFNIALNVSGIDLYEADFRKIDLEGVNLAGAYLQGADFRETNLKKADLRKANLEFSNFEGAYLSEANLENANLCRTKLRGIDFSGINLSHCKFWGASLYRANFRGANVECADLRNLSLEDVSGVVGVYLPPYSLIFTKGQIQIEDQIHLVEEWIKMQRNEIESIDRVRPVYRWWIHQKESIINIYKSLESIL
jgi:hypothetical protein